MKAIEILYNLNPYQHLLDELYQSEKVDGLELVKALKSQYNFISLELKQKQDHDTILKIEFELKNSVMVLADVYTKNGSKKVTLEKQILENKEVHEAHWHTEPNNTWYHDNEVTSYVNIADEIAKAGANCNAGDNYYPGYYSEIIINDDFIVLSQINLHNSRSIDHKSDYHMRKLIMTIPLSENAVKPHFTDYEIGNLYIEFSDSSSKNNRACGAAIIEQILKQKADFQ